MFQRWRWSLSRGARLSYLQTRRRTVSPIVLANLGSAGGAQGHRQRLVQPQTQSQRLEEADLLEFAHLMLDDDSDPAKVEENREIMYKFPG